MAIQVLTQRDYSKGLIPVTQTFGSPPGSVTRISNMTYARRGGLATVGGTRATYPSSGYKLNAGPTMDGFFFNPAGITGYEVALQVQLGSLQITLVKIVGNYTSANILKVLPVSNVTGSAIGVGGTITPSGGVVGQVCAGAHIIQFANNLILLLGNGLTPIAYPDGGPGAALLNNFVSSYPAWTASTAFLVDTIIVPTVSNGHIYKCIQQGTTGLVEPTFPTTSGLTVLDGGVTWQEYGSDGIQAPPGAAHGVVHAGFLWLYNTAPTTAADFLSGPACLQMSDLNTFNVWNPLNLAHLDRDDGTEGTGLASFAVSAAGIAPTLALAAFKTYKTFLINGVFGASDFLITRIRTDMGCIAPRSIQVVGGLGIIRLTHRGFALFDGIQDTLISDSIRPYLFQEQSDITAPDPGFLAFATSGQFADPPTYCCAIPMPGLQGQMTRLLVWDVTSQAWSVFDLPFGVLGMTQLFKSPFIGKQPMMLGGFGGDYNGVILEWQPQEQQTSTWSTAFGTGIPAPVAWSFTTPEVFAKAPSSRVYFRRMLIRGSYFGTNPLSMAVTVTVNGTARPQIISKRFNFNASTQFECEVPIGVTGLSAHAQISGLDSVEIGSVEWHLVPKPEGPPASFMQ